MKFSTVLAAGLATIASAAPVDSELDVRAANKGVFKIANFNFGCTSDCGWLFNVTIPYSGPNHRPVNSPSQCKGTVGAQKGFVDCTEISDKQTIRAYIGEVNEKTGGSKLFLEYQDSYPKKGSYYVYSGNTTVYSQTGPQASKQKKNFSVAESKAVGVA